MPRFGHNLPFSEWGNLPLERLHYSETCRTSYARNTAIADSRV